jgi:hypothetical protein
MAGPTLCRTSDRFENAGRRICVALAMLGVPIAVAIAWNSHAAAAEDARNYAATLHRAEATTLEAAPEASPVRQGPPSIVEARWTGPDRAVHGGAVRVPPGSAAGYELMIWTTATGEQAAAPPSGRQLVIEAVLLAAKVMLGIAGVAAGAQLLLRLGVERWRSREWDLAWEAFAARDDRG